MKPRKRSIRREEQALQISFVRSLPLLLTHQTVFFHVPNGGFRTYAEAGIFKAMGVKAGIPDLVFIHDARAVGLEFKLEGTKLSDDQVDMHAALALAGMRIATVRSVQEAIDALIEFDIPLRCQTKAAEHPMWPEDARV